MSDQGLLFVSLATALAALISAIISICSVRIATLSAKNQREAMVNQKAAIDIESHLKVSNALSERWKNFNKLRNDLTKEDWKTYEFGEILLLLEEVSRLENDSTFGKMTSTMIHERINQYLIGILDDNDYMELMKSLKAMGDEEAFAELDTLAGKCLDKERLEKFRREIMSIPSSLATPRKK